MDETTLPRHVAWSLGNRLRVMPAVVVTGARQTGKSTLARDLCPGDRPLPKRGTGMPDRRVWVQELAAVLAA